MNSLPISLIVSKSSNPRMNSKRKNIWESDLYVRMNCITIGLFIISQTILSCLRKHKQIEINLARKKKLVSVSEDFDPKLVFYPRISKRKAFYPLYVSLDKQNRTAQPLFLQFYFETTKSVF